MAPVDELRSGLVVIASLHIWNFRRTRFNFHAKKRKQKSGKTFDWIIIKSFDDTLVIVGDILNIVRHQSLFWNSEFNWTVFLFRLHIFRSSQLIFVYADWAPTKTRNNKSIKLT